MKQSFSILLLFILTLNLCGQPNSIQLTTIDNLDTLTAMAGDEIELNIRVNTFNQALTGFQCFLSFDEELFEPVPYDEFPNGWWFDYEIFNGIVIFADDHDDRIGELPRHQLDWCIQTGIGNPRPAYPINGNVCKIKLRLLQAVDELHIGFDHDWDNFRNTIYWSSADNLEHYFDEEISLQLRILENTAVSNPINPASEFELSAPWPNPFNPTCYFRINLPNYADTWLRIFDLNGREISARHFGWMSSGWHQLNYTAEGLGSGIYLMQISAGTLQQSQIITLLK
jgi:hypothetical protein